MPCMEGCLCQAVDGALNGCLGCPWSQTGRKAGKEFRFELRVFPLDQTQVVGINQHNHVNEVSTECKPLTTFKQLADVWLDAGRRAGVHLWLVVSNAGLSRIWSGASARTSHTVWLWRFARLNPSVPRTCRVCAASRKPFRARRLHPWRTWIESVALRCHLSAFRMLKAALPAGWLGQARSPTAGPCRGCPPGNDIGMMPRR